MSTVTTYLNLVKAALLEQYSLATHNNNLDLIDAELARIKYRVGTYTPTWGGIANQGTSPTISGDYIRIGKHVIASFYHRSGTGASLGTANITVTLPFTAAAMQNGGIYSGNAGLHSPGIGGLIYDLRPIVNGTANFAILYAVNTAAKNSLVSPGSLAYPYGASDVFQGTVHYLTNDA